MKKIKLILIAALMLLVLLSGSFYFVKDEQIIDNEVEPFSGEGLYDSEFPIEDLSPKKLLGDKIFLENTQTAEDTAIDVEEVLFEIYGEEQIIQQRPYHMY